MHQYSACSVAVVAPKLGPFTVFHPACFTCTTCHRPLDPATATHSPSNEVVTISSINSSIIHWSAAGVHPLLLAPLRPRRPRPGA